MSDIIVHDNPATDHRCYKVMFFMKLKHVCCRLWLPMFFPNKIFLVLVRFIWYLMSRILVTDLELSYARARVEFDFILYPTSKSSRHISLAAIKYTQRRRRGTWVYTEVKSTSSTDLVITDPVKGSWGNYPMH